MKTHKIYLHYEGTVGPEYTIAISEEEKGGLLEEWISVFCSRYELFSKTPLDPSAVELVTSKGEKLQRYGDTLMTCSDFVDVRELDDLFLRDCKKRVVKKLSAAPSSSSSKTASVAQRPQTSGAAGDTAMVEVKKSIATAQNLMGKLYYRKARDIISEGLKKAKKDCSLNELMCELLLLAKKDEEAVEFAEITVEIATSLSTPSSRSGSAKKYLYFLLARAHFAAGNLEDCFAALKRCTDELGGLGRTGSTVATMMPLECAKPSQRPHAKGGKVHYPWFHLDIAALRAECLFALGRHMEAADVVNNCMGDPNCESHMGILLAYSSFAAQYGKVPEAMRSLLKIVVVDQTEKKSRRLLASLLSTEEGIQEIQRQLPVGEKSSSAYGFLAMVAKDHSAIPASIQMLEFSLGGNPLNVGYLLNLMHVIELQGKYQDALDCCMSFLKIHGALVRVKDGGFSSADLLAAMTGSGAGSSVSNADEVGLAVEWVPGSGEYERPKADSGDGSASREYGYVRVVSILKHPSSGEFSLGDCDSDLDTPVPEEAKTLYDGDSLDLLAVAFTVVKLLYLQGRLHLLPAVYRCVERSRQNSKEPMHETNIRNEHAYYQCIAQILAYRLACSSLGKEDSLRASPAIIHSFPPPAYLQDPTMICPDFPSLTEEGKKKKKAKQECSSLLTGLQKPLYVIGDSHIVPLAWSVVEVGGQPRVLYPLLATGIKHYHLRSAGDFYPKAQFANNLKRVPDGSDIMFVCGEIDCREGLLVAVEKDVYRTITEGMRSTLKHFTSILPPLFKQRRMGNVYVHPVLPMLDETRPIVLEYNRLYKESVTACERKKEKEKWGGGTLRWLDFFGELFQPPDAGADGEEGQLLSGLRMDGTHISPSYVGLLQRNLV